MMKKLLNSFILLSMMQVGLAEQNALQVNLTDIKEIMESIITPASNTLWGVDEPSSDKEWKTLEEAAIATIEAGKLIDRNNKDWQGHNKQMIDAAKSALDAILSRDLDKLYSANDSLYPPCVSCHEAFHPNM